MNAIPTDEVAQLAINLARSIGYATFPCLQNKRPACPHGFKNATTDPDAIAELWRNHQAPLIGIATGRISGIDVLDLDLKQPAVLEWWQINQSRLPPTATFRTRSGGLHLYLIHTAGLGCSAGKLGPGVDVRADGGYVVSWFAAGLPCLDHNPPTAWPAWLLDELLSKPSPSIASRPLHARRDRAIDGVLRAVASATEGKRNEVLHWAACRLGEQVRGGLINRGEAERLLLAAAIAAGLSEREARATAKSGLGRAA